MVLKHAVVVTFLSRQHDLCCAVVLCVACATVTGKQKTRKVENSKNLVETEKRENSSFRVFEFSRVARATMSGRRKTRKVENSKNLV